MQATELSDDAIRFWAGYFMGSKNTLRFGGDHAQMEITERGRAALDQLLKFGAVKTVEPDDSWPGREHYGSTGIDLRDEIRRRGGKRAFEWVGEEGFTTFRRKAGAEDNGLPATSVSMVHRAPV